MEPSNPLKKTVEEIFQDFIGRKNGLMKALTTDADVLCQQCNTEEEELCLFSTPDESWVVKQPIDELSDLPEPKFGINIGKAETEEKNWLSLVGIHSDIWLLSIAFYYAAKSGFDKNERKELFDLINDQPTLFEVVKDQDQVGEPDHDENICGECGLLYIQDEFWIACEKCNRWYHGQCVNITPEEAESMGDYICPRCL